MSERYETFTENGNLYRRVHGFTFKDVDGNEIGDLGQTFASESELEDFVMDDDCDQWPENATGGTTWTRGVFLCRADNRLRRAGGRFRRNHEARYARAGLA